MPAIPSSSVHHLQKMIELPDLSGTKYRLIEKIASGGMGEVFLVEDPTLDRRVALKVLHAHMVAAIQESGQHHYVEIMVPGTLVGAIVGYATQRYGRKVGASKGPNT